MESGLPNSLPELRLEEPRGDGKQRTGHRRRSCAVFRRPSGQTLRVSCPRRTKSHGARGRGVVRLLDLQPGGGNRGQRGRRRPSPLPGVLRRRRRRTTRGRVSPEDKDERSPRTRSARGNDRPPPLPGWKPSQRDDDGGRSRRRRISSNRVRPPSAKYSTRDSRAFPRDVTVPEVTPSAADRRSSLPFSSGREAGSARARRMGGWGHTVASEWGMTSQHRLPRRDVRHDVGMRWRLQRRTDGR